MKQLDLEALRQGGIVSGPVYAELVDELTEQIESLKRELEDLRVSAQVRGAGCQCGDDEACAFLRRAQQAEAKLAELVNNSVEYCVGCEDLIERLQATEQERDRLREAIPKVPKEICEKHGIERPVISLHATAVYGECSECEAEDIQSLKGGNS